MSQFISIIRSRMKVGPSKALFFLVNNRSLVSLSKTLAEIYAENRSEDGFLYIHYASQEVFGWWNARYRSNNIKTQPTGIFNQFSTFVAYIFERNHLFAFCCCASTILTTNNQEQAKKMISKMDRKHSRLIKMCTIRRSQLIRIFWALIARNYASNQFTWFTFCYWKTNYNPHMAVMWFWF